MPAAKTILSATQANSTTIFDAFKAHTNAPRIDTRNHIVKLIREAYPEHHVTEVEEGHAALFDFAAADKAVSVIDFEDEVMLAARQWHAVGEGVEKKMHPGSLSDEYRFVRLQYVWEDKEYLVYYIQWQDLWKSADKMFYILSPRASSTITDGHCAETDALILAAGKWTSQLHEEIFVFDNGYWTKSKKLWASVNVASWDDVILDPEMKKNLIDDVQGFFNNQKIYQQFAVPWKRGVILHGVPGNGKTVSIKALMSSLYARPDAIPSLYVKSLEANCQTEQYSIRQIFNQARKQAPCLLIFEDLDSLVGDDVRSYFLNEVDGLESNDGILMIGSTNHLDKLDPAISKRPSRFDRKYHYKLPQEPERKLYAEYWRKKLADNETIDFPEELNGIVAQLTEGFSFAYLKELFVMALLSMVRGFNPEDFEIVEKEEAASADEADAASKTEEGSDKEKKEETCSCATKCATCNKPLPAKEAEKKEDAATKDEKKEETKMSKMVMPEVDIPSHLADNLLLKVIKHQIRILHSEMDNTKEEALPGDKKDGGKKKKETENAAMRRLRRNAGRC